MYLYVAIPDFFSPFICQDLSHVHISIEKHIVFFLTGLLNLVFVQFWIIAILWKMNLIWKDAVKFFYSLILIFCMSLDFNYFLKIWMECVTFSFFSQFLSVMHFPDKIALITYAIWQYYLLSVPYVTALLKNHITLVIRW